jgi:hypothetical protein
MMSDFGFEGVLAAQDNNVDSTLLITVNVADETCAVFKIASGWCSLSLYAALLLTMHNHLGFNPHKNQYCCLNAEFSGGESKWK